MKSLLFFSLFAATCSSFSGCTSGVDTTDEKTENSFKAVCESAVIFHRRSEPNENAFSFLLPEGWTIAGGITRVEPNGAEFYGHSIEAKVYLKLSSPDNKAGMAWLPDMRYIDRQHYPEAKLAEDNTPGGNDFNNMMAMSKLVPADFIRLVAFPFAHPHARQPEITEVQALPGLVEQFRQMADSLMPGNGLSYQAAVATIKYTENNIIFLEKMVCVIEDEGIKGSGIWGNRATWYVRAEPDKFDACIPIFTSIRQSIKINTKSEWNNAFMYSLKYHEIDPGLTVKEDLFKI